jgi:hypothetical protein
LLSGVMFPPEPTNVPEDTNECSQQFDLLTLGC